MGNKRRRIALSCVACRRRKVRCDRAYPACVRCQNGGQTDSCNYVPYEGEPSLRTPVSLLNDTTEGNDPAPSPADHAELAVEVDGIPRARGTAPLAMARKRASNTLDEIAKLRQQIAEIEARTRPAELMRAMKMDARPAYHLPTGAATADASKPRGRLVGTEPAPRSMDDVDSVLLRGKGFRTLYYGPSNAANVLKQFDALPKFTNSIKEHFPTLENIKKGKELLRKKRKAVERPAEPYDVESLLAHIPDRPTTDAMVEQYLAVIETTYRILHVPTFLREYEEFWQAPRDAPLPFLVILLLVLATVYCVPPWSSNTYIGRSSVRREATIQMINACERWMQVQSDKHVTINTYQIQVLLVVARRMNSVKIKQDWASAGRLLRLAMGAGFHREPAMLSSKISVFDQEIRRRLWATILELEIQMCVDRGMPAGIASWDCHAPSNIDDGDLDESMVDLPPPKPRSQFTRTTFLSISQQHAPLRIELLARVNAVNRHLPLDDVLQYDTHIRQAIHDLPEWTADAPLTDTPRILSRLLLHEFLLLIHRPLALVTDTRAVHFHSCAASRDAAINTLDLTFNAPAPLAFIFGCFRDDNLRAALSICHDLCGQVDGNSVSRSYDTAQAVRLLERALETCRERVVHLGQGLHSNWILSSAYFLVQTTLQPEQPPGVYAQEAADWVSKIHQYILERQEPSPDGDALANPLENYVIPAQTADQGTDGERHHVGHMEPTMPVPDAFDDGDVGPGLFNLAEIWNLDTYTDW